MAVDKDLEKLLSDKTADQLGIFRDHIAGQSVPQIAGKRCVEIKSTKRAINRASKLHSVGDRSTRIGIEHARLDELLTDLDSAGDQIDFERVKLKIKISEVRIRLLSSSPDRMESAEDSRVDLDKAVSEYVKEKSQPIQLDLIGKNT